MANKVKRRSQQKPNTNANANKNRSVLHTPIGCSAHVCQKCKDAASTGYAIFMKRINDQESICECEIPEQSVKGCCCSKRTNRSNGSRRNSPQYPNDQCSSTSSSKSSSIISSSSCASTSSANGYRYGNLDCDQSRIEVCECENPKASGVAYYPPPRSRPSPIRRCLCEKQSDGTSSFAESVSNCIYPEKCTSDESQPIFSNSPSDNLQMPERTDDKRQSERNTMRISRCCSQCKCGQPLSSFDNNIPTTSNDSEMTKLLLNKQTSTSDSSFNRLSTNGVKKSTSTSTSPDSNLNEIDSKKWLCDKQTETVRSSTGSNGSNVSASFLISGGSNRQESIIQNQHPANVEYDNANTNLGNPIINQSNESTSRDVEKQSSSSKSNSEKSDSVMLPDRWTCAEPLNSFSLPADSSDNLSQQKKCCCQCDNKDPFLCRGYTDSLVTKCKCKCHCKSKCYIIDENTARYIAMNCKFPERTSRQPLECCAKRPECCFCPYTIQNMNLMQNFPNSSDLPAESEQPQSSLFMSQSTQTANLIQSQTTEAVQYCNCCPACQETAQCELSDNITADQDQTNSSNQLASPDSIELARTCNDLKETLQQFACLIYTQMIKNENSCNCKSPARKRGSSIRRKRGSEIDNSKKNTMKDNEEDDSETGLKKKQQILKKYQNLELSENEFIDVMNILRDELSKAVAMENNKSDDKDNLEENLNSEYNLKSPLICKHNKVQKDWFDSCVSPTVSELSLRDQKIASSTETKTTLFLEAPDKKESLLKASNSGSMLNLLNALNSKDGLKKGKCVCSCCASIGPPLTGSFDCDFQNIDKSETIQDLSEICKNLMEQKNAMCKPTKKLDELIQRLSDSNYKSTKPNEIEKLESKQIKIQIKPQKSKTVQNSVSNPVQNNVDCWKRFHDGTSPCPQLYESKNQKAKQRKKQNKSRKSKMAKKISNPLKDNVDFWKGLPEPYSQLYSGTDQKESPKKNYNCEQMNDYANGCAPCISNMCEKRVSFRPCNNVMLHSACPETCCDFQNLCMEPPGSYAQMGSCILSSGIEGDARDFIF